MKQARAQARQAREPGHAMPSKVTNKQNENIEKSPIQGISTLATAD
jgi:hypothetical protein